MRTIYEGITTVDHDNGRVADVIIEMDDMDACGLAMAIYSKIKTAYETSTYGDSFHYDVIKVAAIIFSGRPRFNDVYSLMRLTLNEGIPMNLHSVILSMLIDEIQDVHEICKQEEIPF